MGKLWLIVLSAAAGFAAAVAATPDDAERRAYDRGYAEARKAVQNEAVRNGLASWAMDDQSGDYTHFQWSPHTSSPPRWRGFHELSSRHANGEAPKPSERHKKGEDRPEKPRDSEAG